MQLYNLPLNPSTAIIRTIYGNFTSAKAQEVILIFLCILDRPDVLRLVVPDGLYLTHL